MRRHRNVKIVATLGPSSSDLDTIRAKGLSTHTAGGNTARLHVSAGMGSSPFATYRFACPPEVTVLTLTATEANS